tara:strand:- start:15 stop:200 length:186 start_codon:yes stop_codon:yes gene_type:complete
MENNKVRYGEVIGRLLMLLVGFIVVFLGFLTFIHSGEHRILGVLICCGGVMAMFGGLPDND